MRVLFTTTPGCGHLFPMVPLAWAFRCAGHRVLVAGPPAVGGPVRAAGLEHVAVGGSPGGSPRWPAGEPDRTAPPWVELAERALPETVDLVRAWRPHLVVSDYAEYAGPIAAAGQDVPVVAHHGGLHLSDRLAARVLDRASTPRLGTLRRRLGLARPARPIAVLDLCPPSLVAAERAGRLPVRHIPFGAAGTAAPWLWTAPGRPRVCVAMGSVAHAATVAGVGALVRGLADRDVEVVLTGTAAGQVALAEGGALPANIRVAGWLPHDQVLPTCAAVIHHGGSGTAMNALLFGLPQLVVPLVFDQFDNAARLVASGAARGIDPANRTAAAVARELDLLLADPAHRAAARRVAAEIRAMPPPGDVVATLEGLLHARRPTPARPVAVPAARSAAESSATPAGFSRAGGN